MKIISKYKDYYDFLSGIYGVDEKIILDRREAGSYDYIGEGKITAYVCGMTYEGYFRNNIFYWGEKQLSLIGEISTQKYYYKWWSEKTDKYCNVKRQDLSDSYVPVLIDAYEDKEKNNIKEGCPILMKQNGNNIIKYPVLKDVNFGCVMPPKDIYLQLCEWLAPKEVPSPPMENKQKIVSHGFDLKSSFRK